MITDNDKLLCRKIINCFECGRPDTNYTSIYIYGDGPGDRRQVTLGFGITEYGNMKRLIQVYIGKNGRYDKNFESYLPKIGVLKFPLVNDDTFKALLITSAKNDQLFRDSEDEVFFEKYFDPALKFFNDNGFTTVLSLMVLLDSYIQSGCILDFLRSRFNTQTPKNGGDEKEWIKEYVDVRHDWLRTHKRLVLRNTIYRTQFFKDQISSDNWVLNVPVVANGVKVK